MVKLIMILIMQLFMIRLSLASELTIADDLTQDYKTTILTEIEKAEAQGWNQISGVPFINIKKDLDKIKYVKLLPENFTLTIDNKPFAFATWDKKTGTITLNSKRWNTVKDELRFIELKTGIYIHEYFGIIGLQDEFYENSIRLDYMARTKAPDSCVTNTSTILADGGSSTGVAGGGDGLEYIIKKDMIEYFLKIWEDTTSEKSNTMNPSILNSLFNIKIRLWQSSLSSKEPEIISDSYNNHDILVLGIGAEKLQSSFKNAELYLKMITYLNDQLEKQQLKNPACLY